MSEDFETVTIKKDEAVKNVRTGLLKTKRFDLSIDGELSKMLTNNIGVQKLEKLTISPRTKEIIATYM